MPANGKQAAARPTIRDVAERAGVSKSLVSLVLRGSPNVSADRRAAVDRAIAELGYRPNAAARTLREGRSRAIGVLLNDVRHPWFIDLLDGLISVLEAEGRHVVLSGGGRLNRQMDDSVLRGFLELEADGFILAGTQANSPVIAEIASSVPTVTVGWRDIDLPRVDAVANDDLLGATLATRHLIEFGHRRIAHISGRVSGTSNLVGQLRRQGYEDAMRAHGLAGHIQLETGDFTEEGGYRATVRLLSSRQPPTAIFAVDDLTCLGAQSAASEMNVGVPGRLSLVGYDNSYLARLRSIWLTSVDSAGLDAGRLAARTLLARVADPARPAETHLLTPVLQVRGSTAPAPRLAQDEAAVGAQRLAGERRRRVRGEEGHRGGHVTGHQRARQRLPRPGLMERGGRQIPPGRRRGGQSGSHAGDRDPVGAVPGRERPGQRDQRSLARHVGQHVPGGRRPDGVGDHEDDPAEAACGHAGDEGLGEQQRGLHVDRLHPAPGGQVDGGQAGPVERGGRMHQHVAPPVLAEHRVGRGPDLVFPRQVHRRVAGLVQAQHGMARGGQRRHDRAADGARAAGDHRDPAPAPLSHGHAARAGIRPAHQPARRPAPPRCGRTRSRW